MVWNSPVWPALIVSENLASMSNGAEWPLGNWRRPSGCRGFLHT